MAINFAPAQPVYAGGAAQATLAGNSLLASAYSQRAQMQQQQMMQEMSLKANAASEQGQLLQRDRQFADTLRERKDARLGEQNLAYDQMGFKGELASAEMIAHQQQQQEAAQLNVWANSQKLTQQQKVEADQDANALGSLDGLVTKGIITPEEKLQYVAKIKSKGLIDVVAEKMKREQAESMAEMRKSQTALNDQKTEDARRSQLARNADVNNLWKFVPDPTKRADVDREVMISDPDLVAQSNMPGVQGMAAKAAIAKRVNDLMQERGLGTRQTLDPKTGLPVTHDEDAARIKARAEAAKQHGPREMSQEEMTKHALTVAGDVSKAADKAAELGQPWDAVKLKAENQKRMDLFLENLKTIQGAQDGPKTKQESLAKASEMKLSLQGQLSEAIDMRNLRTLPMPVADAGIKMARELLEIIGHYKTEDDLPPLVKRRYDDLGQRWAAFQRVVKSSRPAPAAPTPAPTPPTPAAPQRPRPIWDNDFGSIGVS